MSGKQRVGSGDGLIEASYRLVADDTAFGDVMRMWIDRIAQADAHGVDLVDPHILDHLAIVNGLFDKVTRQDDRDPVAFATLDAPGAAAVLAQDGRVLGLNDLAGRRWGLVRGESTDFGFVEAGSVPGLSEVRRSAFVEGGRRHAILRVAHGQSSNTLAECFVIEAHREKAALIALRELELGWSASVALTLSEAFALSGAEIEVCRLLLDTRNVEEIAVRRGTSVLTTRTQLRAIFSKTGTANQVDLIRLVALLCAEKSRSKDACANGWRDPLGREEVFLDSGGRRIAYSWMGDPEGTPALLVHGLGTGYLWPEVGQHALRKNGIKLIAISRPGFGNSDPPGPGEPAVDCAAKAIVSLRQHLGIDRWPVIATGAGFAAAMHAARCFDSGLTHIWATAPYVPFEKDDQFASFFASSKMAARLIKISPVLAQYTARFFYRAMRKRDLAYLEKRMFAEYNDDLRSMAIAEMRHILATAQALLEAQNQTSIVGDLQIVTHDWMGDLADIAIPVTLLHGRPDDGRDHAWAEDIAEMFAHVDTLEFEGEGDLLLVGASAAMAQILGSGGSRSVLAATGCSA